VTAQQVATSVGAAVFVALDGSKIDPHPSMDEGEADVLVIAGRDRDEQATADRLRPILRPSHP